MAGSIPVHLRHCFSPQGEIRRWRSSTRAAERKRLSARTGFAASRYLGDVSSPQARTLEFGGANTFAASGYPARSVLVLVVMLLVWIPAPAGAEARLLDVSPADGSSLGTLRTVEFEFDSLLIADGAEVTVTKLDGTAFPVEASVDGSTLTGTVVGELPSGNYEIGYSVRSSDGDTNTGSIRVGVDAPEQALSGGLLAVIGIALGLFAYLGVVFRADKKRRPGNQRR